MDECFVLCVHVSLASVCAFCLLFCSDHDLGWGAPVGWPSWRIVGGALVRIWRAMLSCWLHKLGVCWVGLVSCELFVCMYLSFIALCGGKAAA